MTDHEIRNTLDAHELRLDAQRNRLDVQVERLEKLEQRLAAIERAATCGTGPNEPHTNSPAQADVGEAAAVSTDQPPFHVGQVVECVDDLTSTYVRVGRRYTVEAVHKFRMGWEVKVDGIWHFATRFRTIPPTAERESEPTPGMVFMADESRGISTIRAIVECVMMNLHQNNHDFRLRDKLIVAAAPYLEKHEKETAALRAENERLTDERNQEHQSADHWCDMFRTANANREIAEKQLATTTAERDEQKRRNDTLNATLRTCNEYNKVQIDGWESKCETLQQQLAAHREAAEASELQLRRLVDALQPFVKAGWTFRNSVNAAVVEPIRGSDVYDLRAVLNAATATLAAKAASGTNTGEQK